MISRVAESCFWLNRYVERVEVLARMLGVNSAFQLDVDLGDAECWRPLVIVTGQEGDYLERIAQGEPDDAERVQEYLTWNEENPSSLISSLRAARENARTIRETISLEMWETLNDLWVWMGEKDARRLYDRDRTAFYARLRNQCLLFHGLAQATMLHEDPLEFMRLGTAIERMGQTARLLDVKYHSIGPSDGEEESPAEIAQWLAILRFCSGVEPFLKRHTAVPSGEAVADFLMFEPAFARSIVHNVDRAENFLRLVAPQQESGGAIVSRSLAMLDETQDQLRAMTIRSVFAEGLHETLTWIVNAAADLSDAIRRDFFDPEPTFPEATASSAQAQQSG